MYNEFEVFVEAHIHGASCDFTVALVQNTEHTYFAVCTSLHYAMLGVLSETSAQTADYCMSQTAVDFTIHAFCSYRNSFDNGK